MVLSTANLYFTSNDEAGAHVFRTAQTASPGQEAELYREPPGNEFGDIVFANVAGGWYGYFFTTNGSGDVFIKRVPLTGSRVATVLTTPPLSNIDVVNSHHNLATDGTSLYWQDVSSVKKMPIGGGPITTLDFADPNTPTAGVYLDRGNLVYASVNAVRFVPTGGAATSPLVRTIAYADSRVTAIMPADNGTYWGEQNGAVTYKRGQNVSVVERGNGVPTSMGGRTSAGAVAWTVCAGSTCRLRLELPAVSGISMAIGPNALGADVRSSGDVFWGDEHGVHRLDL